MSRVCPPPTESPMNVIDWPPYFALIAAAFGTGGAPIAVAEALRVVPAEAMLSETTRASSATDPVPRMNRRRFMSITSFRTRRPRASSIAMNRSPRQTLQLHRIRSRARNWPTLLLHRRERSPCQLCLMRQVDLESSSRLPNGGNARSVSVSASIVLRSVGSRTHSCVEPTPARPPIRSSTWTAGLRRRVLALRRAPRLLRRRVRVRPDRQCACARTERGRRPLGNGRCLTGLRSRQDQHHPEAVARLA